MKTLRRLLLGSTLLVAAATPIAAASDRAHRPASHVGRGAVVSPAARRAFFGELHLHTTMSFDAWVAGTKVTPDMAYKFARGDTVMVPGIQVLKEQGLSGGDVPARRSWPLDFTAVTDHSEYLGAVAQLDVPGSGFSKSAFGKQLSSGGRAAFFSAARIIEGEKGPAADDMRAAAADANAWAVEVKAANANYQPGKFTTFIAYEWTASPGQGIHMHRNVIFNSDHAPSPFTGVDSNRPEDLWKYLDSARAQGIDVLAIPHNSNLSDGKDFDWNMSSGRPIDAAYAQQRVINEPLTEIYQTKGSSDTTPELSPSDEFANFQIMDRLYAGEASPRQHGSYVREAFGRGLVIQRQVGINPFKMGVVAASDNHNGLSVSDEQAYAGGPSGLDPRTMSPSLAVARTALDLTNQSQIVRPNGQKENDPLQLGSAGVTGVWAEANTRESIFAALKRKETFGTSGTRIRVRMFGSWNLPADLLRRADWVATAYAQGVPMGSDLPARPKGLAAPLLVLEALKDPDGANLDRIQVIKLSLEGQTYRERIFDVALSGARKIDPKTGRAPLVGNTVDLKTGTYANSIGAAALAAVWRDPTFNPGVPAVYYARVLEIPTPRWTTLLALRNHLPIPARSAPTLQERAWTSPIWFTPAMPHAPH
jgi:hypothetical protein